jgi:hypothetical protein
MLLLYSQDILADSRILFLFPALHIFEMSPSLLVSLDGVFVEVLYPQCPYLLTEGLGGRSGLWALVWSRVSVVVMEQGRITISPWKRLQEMKQRAQFVIPQFPIPWF